METIRPWTTEWKRRLDALHPVARWVIALAMAVAGVALLLTVAAFSAAAAFLHAAPRFPRPPYRQPSRLYGQATHLAVGAPYEARLLADELAVEGYREAPAGGDLPRGAYRREGDAKIAIHLRRFPTEGGTGGGGTVEVAFLGDQVRALSVGGRPAGSVDLEPPLLASYYGPDIDERAPVTLAELPRYVSRAVLAAEDSGFYEHPGVSVAGIARAAWVDLSGHGVAQGGSTLTQQLVKNLYLTQRRTLSRKAREVFLAFLVELRHGKDDILEAYLNEIYWGKSGPANLIGLGAAARAYFGKEASSLSLAEAATLAGMIRSPGDYAPTDHPERAVERRNLILRRMADLGWVDREHARAAEAETLPAPPPPIAARRTAPYFADAAADEADERFGLKNLADSGYLLFSTLRFRDQRRAEEAVARGLAELEKGPERKAGGRLQSALVSTDPRDGAILAYVGGSDYAKSQFDRIAHARRQAGSAWKPVVYAAAFADAVAAPATYLQDSPIVVRYGNERWQPQDYDRTYRGWVTARAALEDSLNVPAVRLALSVGLGRVVELAGALGIETPLEPVPSLALGSFAVTPRELATVYATLAGGGSRPTLHGLAAVRDPAGNPLLGGDLPPPKRVLEPQAAYLVTSVLQGVLERGTAQAARRQGVRDQLAGKTGTTNGRRDNWFAGYSPDRATVVWVGYDDDSASHLSGSSAALPIWSRFTAALRPAGGYPGFAPPAGLVVATVDPTTGQLATAACPVAVTDLFLEFHAPRETCAQHPAAGSDRWLAADLATGTDGGVAESPEAPAPRRASETWTLRDVPAAPAGDGVGTILIRRAAPAQPAPAIAPAQPASEDGGDDGSTLPPDPPAEPVPPPPS